MASVLKIPESLPDLVVCVGSSSLIFPEKIGGKTDAKSDTYPISIGLARVPREIELDSELRFTLDLAPQVFYLCPMGCLGIPMEDTLAYYFRTKESEPGKIPFGPRVEREWVFAEDYISPLNGKDELILLIQLLTSKAVIPGLYTQVFPAMYNFYNKFIAFRSPDYPDLPEDHREVLRKALNIHRRMFPYPASHKETLDLTTMSHMARFHSSSFSLFGDYVSEASPTFVYYNGPYEALRYSPGYSMSAMMKWLFHEDVPVYQSLSTTQVVECCARLYVELVRRFLT